MTKEKSPPPTLVLSEVLETWRGDNRVKSWLDDLQTRYNLTEGQLLTFIHALSAYNSVSRSLVTSFNKEPLVEMFGTKEKMGQELGAFAQNFSTLLQPFAQYKKKGVVITL